MISSMNAICSTTTTASVVDRRRSVAGKQMNWTNTAHHTWYTSAFCWYTNIPLCGCRLSIWPTERHSFWWPSSRSPSLPPVVNNNHVMCQESVHGFCIIITVRLLVTRSRTFCLVLHTCCIVYPAISMHWCGNTSTVISSAFFLSFCPSFLYRKLRRCLWHDPVLWWCFSWRLQ